MIHKDNNLCKHYEELRSQVTGEYSSIATPRGLALLLRCGLPAWISAWTDCLPVISSIAPSSLPDNGNERLDSLHSEVAVLLVSMALQAQKRYHDVRS